MRRRNDRGQDRWKYSGAGRGGGDREWIERKKGSSMRMFSKG